MNKNNLTVGQTLIEVMTLNRREPKIQSVTVDKIGRDWATTKCERGISKRVNLEKLFIDGEKYSSPGRCYMSMKDYEEETLRHQEWNDLRNRLCHLCPDHLTLEDVRALRLQLIPEKV